MAKKKAVKKPPEMPPQDAAERTNSEVPLGESGKPLYSETNGVGYNKQCSGCKRWFKGSRIKCPCCGKDYPRTKGKRMQGKASSSPADGQEANGRPGSLYDLAKALLAKAGSKENAVKIVDLVGQMEELEASK